MVRFRAGFVVVVGLFQLCSGLVVAADIRTEGRDGYEDAVTAMNRGAWTDYEKIRSGLDSYPLAMYLDYFKLSRNVKSVRASEARRFLSFSQDQVHVGDTRHQ